MSGLYGADDYTAALRALLPRGRAWPEEPDSTFMQTVAALAAIYAQSDEDAQALLTDAFPVGTVDLLPEWEETLGLPDPCAGDDPSLAQRQAAVLARLVAGGGLSRSHFSAVAEALGFDVSMSTFAPARAGILSANDPVRGEAWAFAWAVKINADANDLGAAVLQCELDAIKPAGTIVIVS